jgi:prevent-host-death family protein
MKVAPVTDLKNRLSHYLRLVARGETITVLDRGNPIAHITPIEHAADELRRLAAEGVVRLPVRAVPADLWTRPLPRAKASVVAALQDEREDRIR